MPRACVGLDRREVKLKGDLWDTMHGVDMMPSRAGALCGGWLVQLSRCKRP